MYCRMACVIRVHVPSNTLEYLMETATISRRPSTSTTPKPCISGPRVLHMPTKQETTRVLMRDGLKNRRMFLYCNGRLV